MIEAEHTAGPWQFREQGDANEFVVLDHAGRWLFSIRHNGEELFAKQLANLRLVAAGPVLLSALEELSGIVQGLYDDRSAPLELVDSFTLQPAQAAIKLARRGVA
jgi:hypothetical protein